MRIRGSLKTMRTREILKGNEDLGGILQVDHPNGVLGNVEATGLVLSRSDTMRNTLADCGEHSEHCTHGEHGEHNEHSEHSDDGGQGEG